MNVEYILRQVEPGIADPLIINLNEEEVFIGRQMIPELTKYIQVSRMHAYIKKKGVEFFVKDLGSLNGVYVNGAKISKDLHKLEVGDLIGFGDPSFNGGGFLCTFIAKIASSNELKREKCELGDVEENPVKKIKQENVILENDASEVLLKSESKYSRDEVRASVSVSNDLLHEQNVQELKQLGVTGSEPVKIKQENVEAEGISNEFLENIPILTCDKSLVCVNENTFNSNILSDYKEVTELRNNSSGVEFLNSGIQTAETVNRDQTAEASQADKFSGPLWQSEIELIKDEEYLQNCKNDKTESYLLCSSHPGIDLEQMKISKSSYFTNENDFLKTNNLSVEHKIAVTQPLQQIHDDKKFPYTQPNEIISTSDDDVIITSVSCKPSVNIPQTNCMQSHFNVCKSDLESANNFKNVSIKTTNKPLISVTALANSFENCKEHLKKSNVENTVVNVQMEHSINQSSCPISNSLLKWPQPESSFKQVNNLDQKSVLISGVYFSDTSNKNDSINVKGKKIVKSCGKTLLIEPKPMHYRNSKLRGKEKWFKEQNSFEVIVKRKNNVRMVSSSMKECNESVKRSFASSHVLGSKCDTNISMEQISEPKINVNCISTEAKAFKLINTTELEENAATADESKIPLSRKSSKTSPIARRPENYNSRLSSLVETILGGKRAFAKKTVQRKINVQVAKAISHPKQNQLIETNMKNIQNKTDLSLLQNMPVNSLSNNLSKEDLKCPSQKSRDSADRQKEHKLGMCTNKIMNCSNHSQSKINIPLPKSTLSSITCNSNKRSEESANEQQEFKSNICSNKMEGVAMESPVLIDIGRKSTFAKKTLLKEDKLSSVRKQKLYDRDVKKLPVNTKKLNNAQYEYESSISFLQNLPVNTISNLNIEESKPTYSGREGLKFGSRKTSRKPKEKQKECDPCVSLNKINLVLNTNIGSKGGTISTFHGKSSSVLNNHLSAVHKINYYSLLEEVVGFDISCLRKSMKVHERFPFGDIRSLPLSFDSIDAYTSSFRLAILAKVWDSVCYESKRILQEPKKVRRKFYMCVLSYEIKNGMMELQCESIVNKLSFSPCEGFIILLDCKHQVQDNYIIGYVNRHYTGTLNLHTLTSEWKHLPPEFLENASIVKFTVYIKIQQTYPLCRKLMTANGVCSVKGKLMLADAFNYLQSSPLQKDILLPNEKTFFVSYPPVSPSKSPFSYSQKQAILGISDVIHNAAFDPKIILLHGACNTGKTQTIIGLLQNLLSNNLLYNNNSIKILITAPSNAAVDKIGRRLIEANENCTSNSCFIKFVRLGLSKYMHHQLVPYSLDAKADKLYQESVQTEVEFGKKELNALEASINELKQKQANVADHNIELKLQFLTNQYKCMKQCFNSGIPLNQAALQSYKLSVLSDTNVVLSTLGSSSQSILMSAFSPYSEMCFTCCIVDEATNCSELEILQPLRLGFNKLILFGNLYEKHRSFHSRLGHALERSMFERFHLFFQTCRQNPIFTLGRD